MEALFLKVLSMSATATYVLLAVLVLRLMLRRAPKWLSYALWSLVLFRLVCPVSIPSAFSVFGRLGKAATADGALAHIPENLGGVTPPQTGIGRAVINGALPAAAPAVGANPAQTLLSLGAYIWLAGVALMLIYSVVSYQRLKRRLTDATLAGGNIYETDKIASPFVCGFIAPKIYLPVGLTGEERDYVLRHEETHIARRDYLIKPLAFLVLSVHWFNPFLWLGFVLMSRDLEMSCDEKVIAGLDKEGKTGYSAALMRLATKGPILAGSPLAFGESGAKGRVKNVLNYKKPAFWVLVAAAAAVLVAAVCLLTDPAGTPPKAPEPGELPAFARAYAFDENLYTNPLSSYIPFEGTGQLYLLDPDTGFTIVGEETGEVQENIPSEDIDWYGKEVDAAAWDALFMTQPVDIGAYSLRMEYAVGDRYRVYQMDSQVWLAAVNLNGGSMWSLYRLKETGMPATQMNWRDVRLGMPRGEVHKIMGQEYGMLSGLFGDVYTLSDNTSVIFYYSSDEVVQTIRQPDGTVNPPSPQQQVYDYIAQKMDAAYSPCYSGLRYGMDGYGEAVSGGDYTGTFLWTMYYTSYIYYDAPDDIGEEQQANFSFQATAKISEDGSLESGTIAVFADASAAGPPQYVTPLDDFFRDLPKIEFAVTEEGEVEQSSIAIPVIEGEDMIDTVTRWAYKWRQAVLSLPGTSAFHVPDLQILRVSYDPDNVNFPGQPEVYIIDYAVKTPRSSPWYAGSGVEIESGRYKGWLSQGRGLRLYEKDGFWHTDGMFTGR
ncbi:MAG TPA: M56 family metallopeptidase [Candidatus Acidoferrum sp.]|nr:M56 family metallopeptidase [Candidatus Acidoferrum sp.]